MSCRRRPMHTCAASILAMAQIACRKVQGVNGPIGSVTKKMATLATTACPFAYAIQCKWLAVLSFADDGILAIEDKVENLFPPSTHVFNKLDDLIHTAETLPGRFDDATDTLPLIIHKVPLLDWVLAHVVSWLNFFLSMLADWGPDAAREKGVIIDINCNNPNNESSSIGKMHHIESHGGSEDMVVSPAQVEGEGFKCSYKEALEKGKKEEIDENEDDAEETEKTMVTEEEDGLKAVENASEDNENRAEEKTMKTMVTEEEVWEGTAKDANKDEESINNDDPVLDSFESGRHMKPGRSEECLPHSQSQSQE